ncbi:putative bifunctional diguanylate cyclase/phosphodiesterase [Agrobacterium rosae]|uniref:EAL domain-containing protein n=1 Tax=Agrobacterium rosae TaxID=1972867 RepID=A0AAW9FMX8_9HYPH|nr:EAL domain-containing protein [Agrobacterium rosae]MDX8305768.1 EAL domain-containing protein [Agrobacterium rosae]
MSKPAVKTAVFFLSVLACTFLLSYAWEHGWEAKISRLLDLPYDEDFEDAERWRFIITIIAFSALSLVVPTAAMHFLFVRLAVSHTQLLSSRETAVSMAFTDALTGLPNRRSLTGELEAIAEKQPSPEKVHALILIDLDRFKSVNDVFGHGIGDLLLKQVGKRLVSIDVPGIVVCRLGGDEFACTVRDQYLTAVEELGQQIEHIITTPFTIAGREHSVGASIGIACMPSHGHTAEELMRRADIALYQAKKSDGSNVQIFDPEHERIEMQKYQLGEALKHALVADNIIPYFQPIVDLSTGNTVGFEALARWVDGSRVISPSIFIPLAEELALINDLSVAIFEKACHAAATWPSHIGVSVNLSPRLLRKTGLALKIQSILLASGIAPTRLTIEITENMRLEDMPLASETLRVLRQIGVKLALDDFGTGFASIHHLKELRFDSLKLDRSYVAELGCDAENDAIVRSTLSLARAMQMDVVSEGIEDVRQLDWLNLEGGRFGQGYLFSKPMPSSEVHTYLNRVNPKIAV